MKGYLGHGLLRVGAGVPQVEVGDPAENLEEILKLVTEANQKNCGVFVLPELCLTGYTCRDLFEQKALLDAARESLGKLMEKTAEIDMLLLTSLPLRLMGNLFNCALLSYRGEPLGITAKRYLPNYREFYEKRQFRSGASASGGTVELLGREIPFGSLVFQSEIDGYQLGLGIEICEDLWAPIPPSSYLALKGANLILNPSASNALVGKRQYRHQLIAQQSARALCGYVYAGSGPTESTTDTVYEGEALISENGKILSSSTPFPRKAELIVSEIDLGLLEHERHNLSPFGDNKDLERERLEEMETVAFELPDKEGESERELARTIDPHPFVPSGEESRAERCKEIFSIQTTALAKRLDYTGISNCILGISGGLDSTLALLVTVKAFQSMGLDRDGVLAVTMPGLATSERTRSNAVSLMEALDLNWREIDITKACRQHFADIGHDGETQDVTYENVQARERTQILMDLANKEEGLVVGTGDLSELALGWCTYNGDHMSMYAVNVDVPKTLVKYVIRWVAESGFFGEEVGQALREVIETPITPELTQREEGREEIDQQTEEIIGPYELHDFFLYHFLRYGFSPEKIMFLARRAFADRYGSGEIEKWLELFYDKFFSQQFKRSCLPDGPKVGSVSLSPRTDWRMPSDVPPSLWKDRLKDI